MTHPAASHSNPTPPPPANTSISASPSNRVTKLVNTATSVADALCQAAQHFKAAQEVGGMRVCDA